MVVTPPGSHEPLDPAGPASKPEQEAFIGNQTGGRVFLFLGTDDFWRDYREMQERGIRFVREPKEADYGTVAVFEDLYGNRVGSDSVPGITSHVPESPIGRRRNRNKNSGAAQSSSRCFC